MTTLEYPHLLPPLWPLLNEGDAAARIANTETPRWISYPHANAVMQRLDHLLQHARAHRMPHALIVGDTNNGKTQIAWRFQGRHPAINNPQASHVHAPVVVIESPHKPDEGRLYNAILDRFFALYSINDHPEKKRQQVVQLLRDAQTRLILLDEFHNLLSGSPAKQREFLNLLKHLSHILQISFAAFGTLPALRAAQPQEEIANRFEPIGLPRWKDDDAFKALLFQYERTLPLHLPSGLTEPALASRLHYMSGGLIGELARILGRATERAIIGGQEHITLKLLEELPWVPPAERRSAVEKLLK